MYHGQQEIKQEIKEEVMAWEVSYLNDAATVDPLKEEVVTTDKQKKKKKSPKKNAPTKQYTPQCRMCDEKFLKDEELNEHYENNESHKPKRYMCTMCHKSYDYLHVLRSHKLAVHGFIQKKVQFSTKKLDDKPKRRTLECNLCEKVYFYPGSLEHHSIVHSKEKPYLCERCGDVFVSIAELISHTYHNHKQTDFNPKTWDSKSKTDCNSIELECHICYERFPSKLLLESHLKVHRYPKQYECPVCGENLQSLKIHICRSSDNCLASESKLEDYIEREVANFSNDEFSNNFRMSRGTFVRVLLLIKDQINKSGCRPSISGEVQLQLALWYFGTTDVFRTIYSHFNMPQPTAVRCLRRVTQALVDLAPSIINWPRSDDLEEVKNGFSQIGLPNTIGSIGTMQIIQTRCLPKGNINKKYVCKNYPSVMLQAVCDHTLKFTNCYAESTGTITNARMLRQSDVWTYMNKQKTLMFPDDTHLVGNLTYPCLPELMTPYNGNLTDKQEKFNCLLSSNQNTIERTFDLLRRRFKCLERLLDMRSKSIEWVPKYVIACCVLHNICLMRNDLIEVEEIHEVANCNLKPDLRGVDRTRLALGVQKRNKMCEEL